MMRGSLSLESPAITTKPPSQVAVAQGSTLSLCCEVAGSPPPKVQWLLADQSSNTKLAFQENGCLKVNTAKENSKEDYICRATNPFGLAETGTNVAVVALIGCVLHIFYFL